MLPEVEGKTNQGTSRQFFTNDDCAFKRDDKFKYGTCAFK